MPTRHMRGILAGPLVFDEPDRWLPDDPRPARDNPHELDLIPLPKMPLGIVSYTAAKCTVGVPRGWVDGTDDPRPATPRYVLHRIGRTTVPVETKDRVWRHIVESYRDHAGPMRKQWSLYALGVGFGGLFDRARRLTPKGSRTERRNAVQIDLMIEFLTRMRETHTSDGTVTWRFDATRPNIYNRLCGSAYDRVSGRTERRRRQRSRRNDETLTEYYARLARLDEEDNGRLAQLVLIGDEKTMTTVAADQHGTTGPQPGRLDADDAQAAEAVLLNLVQRSATGPASQRIDSTNAELVRRTYIRRERLKDVAADLGMSPHNASQRRSTAVRQITRLLQGRTRLTPRQPRRDT
ncbi:hypothetical protein [Micromonospora sp. KC213]|uniref:hypothetical protein n=1 Tax=Micromonospora sp. KC213 TaxID=2530378 RepID=UPI0010535B72|nr:hypothetical protein [Micromonospora sp. KC213]TDC31756.1 hypothetical protein E1166_27560 [Micromonospora sp. KC213]